MSDSQSNPATLRGLSCSELEALYVAERSQLPVPSGVFVGTHLSWVDSPDAHPLIRPAQEVLFRRLPFGVDFERGRWFFLGHRRLAAGSFDATVGPSRWRGTRCVRLTYGKSRLPGLVRRLLYDEVVPISDSLCIGLGGTDAPEGEGDHFFFQLVRQGEPGP